jgi:hypothetical protein
MADAGLRVGIHELRWTPLASDARALLNAAGCSWLDLRGHLHPGTAMRASGRAVDQIQRSGLEF